MTKADTLRAEIETFKANRAELAEMIAPKGCTTIEGQGHVVVMPGDIVMGFTFEPAGRGLKRTTGAHMTTIGKAPRFSKRDAETLAADLQNGNGEQGEAVHWRTYCERQIASLDDLIARLEAVA